MPPSPSHRRARRRRTARLVAVALAATVGLALPVALQSPAGAQSSDPDAVKAAQEIQAARDRANAASQAMFDAEARLDSLDIEIANAEDDLAAVEAQANAMRTSLQADAQRSFASAGTSIPLLIDLDQANDGITAEHLASSARGAAAVELDDFDAVMKEVNEQRADLERQKERTAQAREQYEELQATAEAEVVRLAEIEEQRLKDVAVQRELERQRQAKLAEERAEADRVAAATAAASAAARSAPASGGGGSSAAAPSGASASNGSSSGGSSSGGSSSGGSSASPAPTPPASNAGSGIVCPVAGPRAFADTWGAARSGGRSHEGVDMMSPEGTPLVAVESGYVQFKTTSLGGNSVWLTGESGTKYFYAHLSAWEGSSRNVSQGEVIGYVGHTGNTTADHLHFEVHPGGGQAVNPYPYVRAVC